jgi:hypothetical protein
LEVKIDDSVKWGRRIYYGQTENKLELEIFSVKQENSVENSQESFQGGVLNSTYNPSSYRL